MLRASGICCSYETGMPLVTTKYAMLSTSAEIPLDKQLYDYMAFVEVRSFWNMLLFISENAKDNIPVEVCIREVLDAVRVYVNLLTCRWQGLLHHSLHLLQLDQWSWL